MVQKCADTGERGYCIRNADGEGHLQDPFVSDFVAKNGVTVVDGDGDGAGNDGILDGALQDG